MDASDPQHFSPSATTALKYTLYAHAISRDSGSPWRDASAAATELTYTTVTGVHTIGFTVSLRSILQNNVNYTQHPTLRCRSSASRRILARRIWDLLCCITRLSNVAI
jgi:hypothetical protein